MPIESDTLPQQAIQYLNEIEQNRNQEAKQLGRIGARSELLNWCNQWLVTAQTWRKQSYETDWLKWQRAADGRYDPVIASKKKDWQSKAFVDITPSHRENIQSELFRLVAGSRPILDVTARPGGTDDQADNIRDLELRELEKSRFEVHYNDTLNDATTYGSGICRIWYEVKYQDRVVKIPITEPLNVMSLGSIQRHLSGQPQVLGYKPEVQPKLIYRGVKIHSVPIWDFFPDPKALKIHGSTHAERSWISLGDLMEGIKQGYYMPEAGQALRDEASNEVVPPDKSILQFERGIMDVSPRRLEYQKSWEYYCLYARLPQKLIFPLLREAMPVEEADKLIAAKVIFHKKTIIGVELNNDYDGEAPFIKLDYFPINGRFYKVGIPEMLKNPQMVVNEVVNQRLDEGNLALQEGFAVIEKAIVNRDELIQGGPGMIVRLDAKALGPNGDVRNAILPLGRPDVKINAGFTEVHEWERIAQERTSANRVTLGSSGLVHDSNRTLGGQRLLKETASGKFAFIAMVQEFTFLYEVFQMYWKLIYSNITPEDVTAAIGQKRAAGFQLMSPEEVDLAYRYEPKGIFEREAKETQQARLASLREQFKGAPWLDDMANFDLQAKSFNLDPEALKVKESDMINLQQMAQRMAQPMANDIVKNMLEEQAMKAGQVNMKELVEGKNDEIAEEIARSMPQPKQPQVPK